MQTDPALDDLLRRIGVELAAQSETAEALGALVPLLPALDAALQRRAQSIDALSQHLAELAALVKGLGEVAPPVPVPSDLIRAVRLSDLAGRLTGRPAEANEVGALDLF